MPDRPRLHSLPCCRDPAAVLVQQLLARHQQQLPDLSDILVVCPEPLAPALHSRLLAGVRALGKSALLPPRIMSLPHWLAQGSTDGDDTLTISPYRRELILVRELRDSPQLYGSGSPWQLATQLLQLFDELSLSRRPLDDDYDAFVAALGAAYALPVPASGLEQEARLVHSLWQAWQQHQQEHNIRDLTGQYLARLATGPGQLPAQIYMLGPPASLAELEFLHHCAGLCELFLFCQYRDLDPAMLPALDRQLLQLCDIVDDDSPATDLDRFCNHLFSTDPQPLAEKSAQWQAHAAALQPQLPRVLCSRDGEQLAQGIADQCGLWLQQGIDDIHIVTEDRKLARRLRALLEHHAIPVQDLAGWALSTTSYASVLERWLQSVEEDFYHKPLLDLLKSPAMVPGSDREGWLRLVYRFEHEIVRFSNIPRGLQHYRHTLQLQNWDSLRTLTDADGFGLEDMLARLQQAGDLIRPFTEPGRHRGAALIAALTESLRILGIHDALAADEAGARILQELELMQLAGNDEGFILDWAEFRAWLGYTLERYNFTPPGGGDAPVRLLNLSQSRHLHAGALVIAAAEARFLPGTETPYPFFNDRVRASLGLADMQDRYNEKLYLFRRLLSSAQNILIARRGQENGEDLLACPWLELLDGAVQASCGTSLPAFHGAATEQEQPAAPAAEAPPLLDPQLVPDALSATDLQMLMYCPYRFYAARGLRLSTPEAVVEQLEKSDFGARVHRCLQAFHEGVDRLPGPFHGALSADRFDEALALMEKISEQVFFHDLEDNFVHRAWHYRWLRRAPQYLRWQIKQQQQGEFLRAESDYRLEDPRHGIALKGRIDRMDRGADGLQIIDYKTGQLPRKADMETGEVLQLPFYALLAGEQEATPITRALYLGLGSDSVNSRELAGEALEELVDALGACVDDTRADLRQGSAMPAWGSEQSCKWCEFGGLCRRALQQDEVEHD